MLLAQKYIVETTKLPHDLADECISYARLYCEQNYLNFKRLTCYYVHVSKVTINKLYIKVRLWSCSQKSLAA